MKKNLILLLLILTGLLTVSACTDKEAKKPGQLKEGQNVKMPEADIAPRPKEHQEKAEPTK